MEVFMGFFGCVLAPAILLGALLMWLDRGALEGPTYPRGVPGGEGERGLPVGIPDTGAVPATGGIPDPGNVIARNLIKLILWVGALVLATLLLGRVEHPDAWVGIIPIVAGWCGVWHPKAIRKPLPPRSGAKPDL
jgi:hypothetical protein